MCAWMLLTAALVSAGAIRSRAADVVEIRLRDRYFIAPATVLMVVAVEPHASNRTLRAEVFSNDSVRGLAQHPLVVTGSGQR